MEISLPSTRNSELAVCLRGRKEISGAAFLLAGRSTTHSPAFAAYRTCQTESYNMQKAGCPYEVVWMLLKSPIYFIYFIVICKKIEYISSGELARKHF